MIDLTPYSAPDNHILPRYYDEVLLIQDACNLSGVVHFFSTVVSSIWVEAHSRNLGTDWVNHHPICILCTYQLSHLTGHPFDFDYIDHDALTAYCRARSLSGDPSCPAPTPSPTPSPSVSA